MDDQFGSHKLFFQEAIPPAPNEAPKAADWLPGFAGFSWLAYGAQCYVVISSAPSTNGTEENATGRFFQQAWQLDKLENEWVKIVGWSPQVPSLGILAAAAGNNIHVLGPRSLGPLQRSAGNFPVLQGAGLPLTWESWEVLRHSFDVSNFAWTYSGDGLLASGSEVIMWQCEKDNLKNWYCLWRVQVEIPQYLCAATLFANGLAATSNGHSATVDASLTPETAVEGRKQHGTRQRATIWCWEVGYNLQEVELLHPQQVLSMQWRPSALPSSSAAESDASTKVHRPILLTCCMDGTVRLWLEVDSGKSRLERAAGKEAAKKHVKPTFFVSAVIEANGTLLGQLGQNIYVTWATDVIVTAFGGAHTSNASVSSQNLKGHEVATCEWLVGIGPSGSIALWSLHCLDDISPPRCPRVLLWEHGFQLVPDQVNPSLVKAFVQRPEGTLAEPPSSLDIFEILQGSHFRWLRVWPPVSAIGGARSKSGLVNLGTPYNSGSPTFAGSTGKKGIWSVASEDLHLDGHCGEILNIAVHPTSSTRLAASGDNTGTVLLWIVSSCYEPHLELENLLAPLWSMSGRLSGQDICNKGQLDVLTWAPLILPGGETVLLVANSKGVCCFLVIKERSSPKAKPETVRIVSKQICTLPWPVFDGQGLEGIYALPSEDASNDNGGKYKCIVLGLGNDGTLLMAWNLMLDVFSDRDLDPEEEEQFSADLTEAHRRVRWKTAAVASDQSDALLVRWHVLGSLTLENEGRVTSVASPSPDSYATKPGMAFDIATGCRDGILRFWKISRQKSFTDGEDEQSCWLCVGLLNSGEGQIASVSLTNRAGRFATANLTAAQNSHSVCIWQAENVLGHGRFRLEDRIPLSDPVSALRWLEVGNGQALLAVSLRREVRVYTQTRFDSAKFDGKVNGGNQGSIFGGWVCLASVPLVSQAHSVAWGIGGSLLVPSGAHIWVSGVRTSGPFNQNDGDQKNRKTGLTFPNSVSLPALSTYRGLHSAENLDERMMHASSYNAISQDPNVSTKKMPLKSSQERLGTFLEAAQSVGSLLPDFHPKKVLWYLNKGDKGRARASIRHLVLHLGAKTETNIDEASVSTVAPIPQRHNVPLMNLTDLFEGDENVTGISSESRSFGFGSSSHSNDRYAFLDTNMMLESSWGKDVENADCGDGSPRGSQIKRGGSKCLTKLELDVIFSVIEQCNQIPGLSDVERIQLLAAVDVLAEMDGINPATQSAQLDQAGQRFWLAARYIHHQSVRRMRSNMNVADLRVNSKAMAWALQSESRDVILDSSLSEQPSWSDMRAVGVGFWYTDLGLLRKRMEKLARAQYLSKKDPKDCMLLYLALDRRSVLTGLFKLSRDERDKHLYEFLTRDFKEEKQRGAALKNAYVLMGKHRHELAASFFLLGGDIASAVSVCAKSLGDPQLALVISRLVEGLDGPAGTDLIRKQLLPAARVSGDFWEASLLQWLIGKKLEAMHELTGHKRLPSGPLEDSTYSGHEEAGIFFPTSINGSASSDPDIGDFCVMLKSKFGYKETVHIAEASRTVRHAMSLAAYALSRSGLPLQALEQLTSEYSRSLSKLAMDEDEASTLEGNLNPNNAIEDGAVGTGWMSQAVLTSIDDDLKNTLALQCASQLLQDHPQWLEGIITWKQLINKLELLVELGEPAAGGHGQQVPSKVVGSDDPGMGFRSALELFEKADKFLDESFQILGNKFSVNLHYIVSQLGSLTMNFRRPYLFCRLRCAALSALDALGSSPSFTTQASLPLAAGQCMKAVCSEAPWILARALLACGGAVVLMQEDSVQERDARETRHSATPAGYDALRSGVLSWPQLQSMIRYGLEIFLLAITVTQGASGTDHAGEAVGNAADVVNKTRQVSILIAYVVSVAAAWLGRRPKALLSLVGPTLGDLLVSPESLLIQLDPAAWLPNVDTVGIGLHSQLVGDTGGCTTHVRFHITDEDFWRVMGVSLWSHLLIYVRKQLSGSRKEASYTSFGRVTQILSPLRTPPISPASSSPIRSPPLSPVLGKGHGLLGWGVQPLSPPSDSSSIGKQPTNPSELLLSSEEQKGAEGLKPATSPVHRSCPDSDPGMPLISSLASVAAGLRRQLACHISQSLEISANDPLVSWLWGKPLQAATGDPAGTSNSPSESTELQESAQSTDKQVNEDGLCKELWKMLVARDKIRSALALEGVIGPKSRMYDEGVTNSLEKKGPGPGSAGSGDGAGSHDRGGSSSLLRDGNTAGKPPPGKTGDKNINSRNGGGEGLVGSLRGPEERGFLTFQPPEEVLHLSGELFEGICVNSCNPDQIVVASNHKGLLYFDLKTHGTFSQCNDNLWGEADWPRNGWAGSVSTPSHTLEATNLGLESKGRGQGGFSAAAGAKRVKDIGKGVSFGVPGYGGMGAWGWGWEEWEEGVVDPPATVENVHTKSMAAHPLRPFFLVGSDNTHVYLWEFGQKSATATYGVLPGVNVPPLYVIPSVSAVKFDRCGHRFATAALDGSVSVWQLEVGGRSNVCPTDSRMCFSRLASDVAFVGASGSILATTGSSHNGDNLIIWDTLAPPNASRVVSCHEGGARCVSMFDRDFGGSSPLIITGGKTGDIAVHDFRYIAGGKSKRHRSSFREPSSPTVNSGKNEGSAGMVWYLPHAHAGGISRVTTVPGTSLFFSASKDGDVKLWDVQSHELVNQWPKVHERHMFLRHNSTGFGAIHEKVSQLESLLSKLKAEAAVTDLQVLKDGFLTCGADGIVKLYRQEAGRCKADGA